MFPYKTETIYSREMVLALFEDSEGMIGERTYG